MVPGFSIVICTNNGAARLEPTLAHLAALQVPAGEQAELIVVDNASTDQTSALAQRCWAALGTPFPLVVLAENRPGKGYAVETGYDAARHAYILTVDDDNWLAPDYLTVARRLLHQHPDVGVLQGRNTAVFEATPPEWALGYTYNFVIGSPVNEPGYFARDNFRVWGAGMVIEQANWRALRAQGFSFLTSKVPGKAAGEDNETAMALMLLGRKVYYSDELTYQHFMPASRITWGKLKSNFEASAYISYYFLLYALVVDAHNRKYSPTAKDIRRLFIKKCRSNLRSFTVKQHIAYWLLSRKNYQELALAYHYRAYKTVTGNLKHAPRDVAFLKSWMGPLLQRREEVFAWPLGL